MRFSSYYVYVYQFKRLRFSYIHSIASRRAMDMEALISEMVTAGLEAEPTYPTAEEDNGEDWKFWLCRVCPRASECSKQAWDKVPKGTYCSELKMRYLVAKHLQNSGKHFMEWPVAAGIALDPDECFIDENIETLGDRNMVRAEHMKFQQKQDEEAEKQAKQAKSMGRGKGSGKRKADDMMSQVSDLQKQVNELREKSASLASSSESKSADQELHDAVQGTPGGGQMVVVGRSVSVSEDLITKMQSAFREVADGLTDTIKDLTRASGNLAGQDAKLRKLIHFVEGLQRKCK